MRGRHRRTGYEACASLRDHESSAFPPSSWDQFHCQDLGDAPGKESVK